MSLRSIAIDRVTGGFILNGDSLSFVEGKDAKAQQARIRFKTVQGEYFLDDTLGFPWFQDVLKKNPDTRVIAAAVRKTLTDLGLTPVSVDFNFDRPNRKATIAWQATDASGDSVNGAV